MENELKIREYQISLSLFQRWLASHDNEGIDHSDLKETSDGLIKSFNRPISIGVLGADTATVRRLCNLLTGIGDAAQQLTTNRFLPILFRASSETEAAMLWWDRSGEVLFDGTLEATEADMPDMVELRGPVPLPADVRLVELANGVGTGSVALINFALGQVCDRLVWVSSAETWGEDKTSEIWTNIPGKLRKSALIVFTGTPTDEIPEVQIAGDSVISLDLAEQAMRDGDADVWEKSGAAPALQAILDQIEFSRSTKVAELGPKADELIGPYATPKFKAAVAAMLAKEAAEKEQERPEEVAAAPEEQVALPEEPVAIEEGADPQEIWLQGLARLDSAAPTAEQIIAFVKETCAEIAESAKAPAELVYDCVSAQSYVDSLDSTDEEAEFLLSCVLCQVANTIGQYIEHGAPKADRDVGEILKRLEAAPT